MKRKDIFYWVGCFTIMLVVPVWAAPAADAPSPYSLHKNITSTIFWAGETAGKENAFISNSDSAWDEDWQEHYGGVDDPLNRKGFHPSAFTPKENPFYFALPYNDFQQGQRDPKASECIPWAKDKTWGKRESICKNRWIKTTKGTQTAYAQWQDVGPFRSDDRNYVFGEAQPTNTNNDRAGLDVSPAVRDYLRLIDIDKVDWQFIDENDVPDGPWKEIITTSQITWH